MGKVFAVIVNWNQKEKTEKCLDSLIKTSPLISIIAVDNGSADNSYEYLKEVFQNNPNINFIKSEKNLGFGGGANLGIKKAFLKGADFILILNNDTIFEQNFLEPLLNEFKKDEKLGIMSPQINYLTPKNKIWYLGGKIDFLRIKTIHNCLNQEENNCPQKSFETDFASGCAMMIKKDVFEKIGFFKEYYFMFWEDTDFSFRAKKAGFRIKVAPASKIYHSESSSIKKSPLKIYYLVRNGLIFAKENYPVYLLAWLYFYFLLRIFTNFIKRIFDKNDENLKAVFLGLKDFIKGKTGKI